jgi:hypothetical protein
MRRHTLPSIVRADALATLLALLWLLACGWIGARAWNRMVLEARMELVGVEPERDVRFIIKALWPSALSLPKKKLEKLEQQICDVLDGRPVPTFSHAEREDILAEGARR